MMRELLHGLHPVPDESKGTLHAKCYRRNIFYLVTY